MNPNRSVRVPLMTRDKVLELRDIRIELEGLASAKAATAATRGQIADIRRAAREIMVRPHSRRQRDRPPEGPRVPFCRLCGGGQPTLLRLIESLWLQTGPYMNLLYPGFISSSRGPAGRQRLIEALQARNPSSHDARWPTISVAPSRTSPTSPTRKGNIAPASPATVTRGHRQRAGAAAFEPSRQLIRRKSWLSNSAISASHGSTASSCPRTR